VKKTVKQKRRENSKGTGYEIAYICNGRNPKCCGKQGCYYGPKVNGITGSCSHTLDPKYAAFKPARGHPCHYPERFDRVSVGDQVRYYEKYGYEE